jgi:hypothetical protein
MGPYMSTRTLCTYLYACFDGGRHCIGPNAMSLGGAAAQEPSKYQLRLFLSEVKQQMGIPTLRSVLKLYSTMPVAKLATFVRAADDSECRCAPSLLRP